jgi:hypothetical protein
MGPVAHRSPHSRLGELQPHDTADRRRIALLPDIGAAVETAFTLTLQTEYPGLLAVACPVVLTVPLPPGDPDELAVPREFVHGAVGALAAFPTPLGPLGTPFTPAVPAPAEPAFGEPTALPVPVDGLLAVSSASGCSTARR